MLVQILRLCAPLMCFLLLVPVSTLVADRASAQNCSSIQSGLGANSRPQNAPKRVVGQSLDEIQERGWITFAAYEDFAPYSYQKDGEFVGVDIDLGRLIANDLGVSARFYAVQAGETVESDLRDNVWKGRLIGGQVANVMLHVPYNRELACRNEQVVLNGQYYNERIAIAYRDSEFDGSPPLPAYFRYDTVGVENDTISDFYLSSIARGQLIPNMRRYRDYRAAMAALRDGNVKAVMGPLGQLEFGLSQGLAVHTPPLPGLAHSQWTVGIAVRSSWRPLSYAVDDAIRAAVQDGRLRSIFDNHGLSYSPPKW